VLPVGERFFQETKYIRGKRLPATRIIEEPQLYKEYPNAPVFYLPEPVKEDGPGIWEILKQRRSLRDYTPLSGIALEDLSQLLWSVQGVTAKAGPFLLRTAPSAGALYPYETYIYAHQVDGLSRGIYHLNVKNFYLELLTAGDFSSALTKACLDQPMLKRASVVFIWSAVIDRSRVKYGERAFRYIFLDLGHACQNLYLAATAMNLGCCAIGAFYDDEVNRLVGIDGERESVVYLATVGVIG